MSFHTANPAGFSHLFPCLVEQKRSVCFRPRATVADFALLVADRHARILRLWLRTSAAGVQMRILLWSVSAVVYAVFCSVTTRGLSRARRRSVFCFAFSAPSGLGSSRNKFENPGRERRANFFRVPPRKQTFGAWEPGPLARLRPG